MEEKLLRIEEVAIAVGVCAQTVTNWYRWKKLNPDNPLASLLPEYVQDGERQKRFWKNSDVWKLIQFKNSIPRGRDGMMGQVTGSKYRKHKKENNKDEK